MPQALLGTVSDRFTRTAKFRRNIYVITLSIPASSLALRGYLVQHHPTADVLLPLLIGFSPIIGAFVLLAVVTMLFSILLRSVEQAFAGGDGCAMCRGVRKGKWHRVDCIFFSGLPEYISLKEHSPPELTISQ